MKKVIIILAIIFLFGCNKNINKYDYEVGYTSNMVDTEDINKLKELLTEKELSNVDTFINLLKDYNKEADDGCGLKNWDDTSNFLYNEAKCEERYEKYHDYMDGNCRMTSYILLKDKLSFGSLKNENGSYLMFDVDVLKYNKNYEFIKDDYKEFVTLFDEIDISSENEESLSNVFSNKWLNYNIKLNTDKYSLITVVMHDIYDKVLFVGHAGILINLKDKYMFIEKIAFENPYQFTIISNKNELIELFSNRSNYFSNEGEKGPFIYENDKLLYEYNS